MSFDIDRWRTAKADEDRHHNNKIQNLELEWVPDKGCFAAMEFR